MKALGNVTLAILVAFLGMYTLSTLWGWFIVPFGIMALSMPHAFGISLIVGYFRIKPGVKNDETGSYAGRLVASGLVMGLILLFGKIATLFM